jgi:hypothetical protein
MATTLQLRRPIYKEGFAVTRIETNHIAQRHSDDIMNEAALKERLKAIAVEKESTLNKVWKQLLLERFLARLSNSSYQDKFIFKVGLLLAR